jgi:hypothetical protein
VVIWYIFPRFGVLHQEKSGNSRVKVTQISLMLILIANRICKVLQAQIFMYAVDNDVDVCQDNLWRSFNSIESTPVLEKLPNKENKLYYFLKKFLSYKTTAKKETNGTIYLHIV